VTETFALGALMSIVCGLDRTAFLQLMISRPVVAGPLTGWLLGGPETGILVGALLELLWLGRLPMGAVIPPDDTQIAVGGTVLAVAAGGEFVAAGMAVTLLSVLLALPLGKVGARFDQWARKANSRLSNLAIDEVKTGNTRRLEFLHLVGLVHFSLSSLATFLVIIIGGWLLMVFLAPFLLSPLQEMQHWVFAVFPLVGMSHVLANMNVNRALSLFGSSFLMTYVLLWLM